MKGLLVAISMFSCAATAQTAVTAGQVIQQSGAYYLASDISSSDGYVLTVYGANVDLDMRGHTLSCGAVPKSSALQIGVYVAGAGPVTIRNGKITGCYFGYHAVNLSGALTVDGVDLSGNSYLGGIVGGVGSIVRNTRCANIGGYASAYAICHMASACQGCTFEDNVVLDVYRQPDQSGAGEGLGFLVGVDSSGTMFRRNRCENGTTQAHTICMWTGSGTGNVTITGNMVIGYEYGVQGGSPVTVNGNSFTRTTYPISETQGVASNNTFTDCPSRLSGGISDGGGNVDGSAPIPPPPAPGLSCTARQVNGKIVVEVK